MIMPVRRALDCAAGALMLLVALSVSGCGGGEPAPTTAVSLPEWDRAAVGPALAARIEERSAAVRAAPSDADAWGNLGLVFDAHDMIEPAVACYLEAEGLAPTDGRWPYLLGAVRQLGDQAVAVKHFEQAVELRDDFAWLWVYLGTAYLSLERVDEASAAFERALELQPGIARAWFGRGQVALLRGEHDAAVEALEKAAEIGVRSGEVLGALAQALQRAGDEAAAERVAAEAAQATQVTEPLDDPVLPELRTSAGATVDWTVKRTDAKLRRGDRDGAVADWIWFLEHEPDNAAAHQRLADVYFRLQRFAEARDAYRRAIELDPTLTAARGNLGVALIRSGSPDAGSAMLLQAADEAPDDADAQYNAAQHLIETNRRDDALSYLERAIAANPSHGPTWHAIGMIRAEAGAHELAAEAFARLELVEPRNASAASNRSRSLATAGQTGEAIAVIEAARERMPENPTIAFRLAWILATTNDAFLRDGERAYEIIEPISAQYGHAEPSLLDALAAACAELGRYDEAVEHLDRALAILQQGGSQRPEVRQLLTELPERKALYESGQPYRE